MRANAACAARAAAATPLAALCAPASLLTPPIVATTFFTLSTPRPFSRSHIAALLNAGFLIPTLLHAGADTAIKDNAGRTAEQLATEKSSDEVLKHFAVLAM